jgi:hypothetical protein
MTLAKAKAKTNETFIVQASLTINTYDCKNMFIVQATGVFATVSHFWPSLVFANMFLSLPSCLSAFRGFTWVVKIRLGYGSLKHTSLLRHCSDVEKRFQSINPKFLEGNFFYKKFLIDFFTFLGLKKVFYL